MDREMATLDEAETWRTILRLDGKNIVGNKCVFRLKCKADGTVDKYKARHAAKGFTQVQGVNYFDTLLPRCETREPPPDPPHRRTPRLGNRVLRLQRRLPQRHPRRQ